MDDVVEKVARAIAIADAKPGQSPLLLTSENYMSATRQLARAAIAAMLEAVGEPAQWVYSRNGPFAVKYLHDERAPEYLENGGTWTETPLYSLSPLTQALAAPPPQASE